MTPARERDPLDRDRAEPRGLYTFPAIYDEAFAEFTADDLRALRRAFRLAGRPVRTVLEPACGTGRLLEALAALGFGVRGFDAARPMVDRARARLSAAGGRVSLARMEAFGPERFRCDAAFNLHASICHLVRERDVLRHFSLIERAIRPGGIYAVGVWTIRPVPLGSRGQAIGTWESPRAASEPWRLQMRVTRRDLGRRRERVEVKLAIGRGRGARRFVDRYWLRTYTTRQWEGLLERVRGLRPVTVFSAEGRDLARPRDGLEMVYVLRRRA